MPKTDERVDLYIDKSAAFAQPILIHLRKLVHAACPKVEETIKWGFPNFEYGGKMLCYMTSFKQHCVFGFMKANEMTDLYNLLSPVGNTTMGSFGKIKDISELPKDSVLKQYIKEAIRLNSENGKTEQRAMKVSGTGVPKTNVNEIAVPDYFLAALKKNKKASTVFEQFSPSNKKEYIDWLEGAKTEATRNKRMAEAIDWISEGKSRHWKYKK